MIKLVVLIFLSMMLAYGYGRENRMPVGDDDIPELLLTLQSPSVNPEFVTCLGGNRYKVIKNRQPIPEKREPDVDPVQRYQSHCNRVSAGEWSKIKHRAFAVYDDKPENREKNGLLYNGYAAASGKLCPAGWRIATDEEWQELEKHPDVAIAELGWTRERANIRGCRLDYNLNIIKH